MTDGQTALKLICSKCASQLVVVDVTEFGTWVSPCRTCKMAGQLGLTVKQQKLVDALDKKQKWIEKKIDELESMTKELFARVGGVENG